MHNQYSGKDDLKPLLTTYSLEELASLFCSIDEKIVSLHQVSSEDFMNLNKDFRDIHGEARQISDNASYLFRFITGDENTELVAGVEQLYQELKNDTEILDRHINRISDVLTRLLSRVRQSFFPIKNFKQNLTSLKFLETNYALRVPLDGQRDVPPLAVQEISEQLRAQLNLIEMMLSRLKQLIRDHFDLRDDFDTGHSQYGEILGLLKREIQSYSDHYQSIREHLPAIKSETQRSSEHIEAIITQLQYQDIIKQKMEHIQQTHKQLLEEIREMDQENVEADEKDKADYFIRIRDIAGLQAAQLMHTNKEYQSAIQKISDKFLEIGQGMTRVSALCNQYVASGKDSPECMSSLKEDLERAGKQLDSFGRYTGAFADKRNEIKHVLSHLRKAQTRLDQYMKQLNGKMERSLTGKKPVSPKDTLVQQMHQLYGDLQNNHAQLDGILGDYNKFFRELDDASLNNLEGSVKFSDNLPAKIRFYLEKLGQIEQQIREKLKGNNEKSEQIYSEVQNSVNRIKYYDYFENVIGEIIEELNTVNYNLKLYSTHQGESKEENLQKLREYYTMHTEFLVHEQVSRGEAPQVDAGEEGGDLELF